MIEITFVIKNSESWVEKLPHVPRHYEIVEVRRHKKFIVHQIVWHVQGENYNGIDEPSVTIYLGEE